VEQNMNGVKFSGIAWGLIEPLAPDVPRCPCSLDRWDEYRVCAASLPHAKSALSFRSYGESPDLWSTLVHKNANIMPRTFVCASNMRSGVSNDPSKVCNYDTLHRLLEGAAKASMLVNIDIEADVWEVLGSLRVDDFARIASLNVEYHVHGPSAPGCDPAQVKRMREVLNWVILNMAVVDAVGVYTDLTCSIEGAPLPQAFSVSYASFSACAQSFAGEIIADTRNLGPTSVGWPWPPRVQATSGARPSMEKLTVPEAIVASFKGLGEVHVDVGQIVSGLRLSRPAQDLFRLIAPDAKRCQCSLVRWDQYAVCRAAFQFATRALSVGIFTEDKWGRFVQRSFDIIPWTFDCFNDFPLTNFKNNFSKICISSSAGEIDGRRYETLPRLLEGATESSVLVKIDVETSEWDVLESLSAHDFARMASLNVEYHLWRPEFLGCDQVDRMLRTLRWVAQNMAVVDASAGYWGHTCSLDGTQIPQILAVSYVAFSRCVA